MKKILILLVMIGVVAMLVLSAGVIAVVPQDANGTVTPDLTLTPLPNPLEFGQMNPGDVKSLPSSLTAGTSNLVVSMVNVTDTDVNGDVFTDGNVMFSEDNIIFFSAALFAPKKIAAKDMLNFFVKLSIPVATPSGDFTGVITYTVMEDLPPPGPL